MWFRSPSNASTAPSRSHTTPTSSGQEKINELAEATDRLTVVVPITLAIIILLVYSSARKVPLTVVVLANIPVASLGGFIALLLTGINNSVSAAMGFVSVFGIAIQDAILVVAYAQREWESGATAEEGVLNASKHRLRAVLMTTFVAMFGSFPAALSNSLGAQTQKPLAVVVIGGAIALPFLSRAIQPALLLTAHREANGGTSPRSPRGFFGRFKMKRDDTSAEA